LSLLLTMPPMLLRRMMLRLRRATVKLVGAKPPIGSSPVSMFNAPTVQLPTRPVTRPPARMGTTRPPSRPMRRL